MFFTTDTVAIVTPKKQKAELKSINDNSDYKRNSREVENAKRVVCNYCSQRQQGVVRSSLSGNTRRANNFHPNKLAKPQNKTARSSESAA